MTPCIWLGTTHPCNLPNYGLWVNLLSSWCVFRNIVFRPCYLFLLWNVVLKCLALCLIIIIAACFLHLYACLTCSSVHASSLHTLLAHHHLCYVDVYCVFLFLIYATFLCDSILDCLYTYFCLIGFQFGGQLGNFCFGSDGCTSFQTFLFIFTL